MKTYILTNLNLTSGTVLGRTVEHLTYGLVHNAAGSMQIPGNRRYPPTDTGSFSCDLQDVVTLSIPMRLGKVQGLGSVAPACSSEDGHATRGSSGNPYRSAHLSHLHFMWN